MSSKYHYLAFLMALVLSLSGCANSLPGTPTQTPDGGETPVPIEIPAEETPERSELDPTQPLPGGLETMEIPISAPATGEVPEKILTEIFADLVDRSGSELVDIQVVRAEAVVWNDGSLGCPQPGEFYIQVLIDGYWVVLEVDEVEYDYRVSDKGSFKLCEGGQMSPITPPNLGEEPQTNLVNQAKEDLADRLAIPISQIELFSYEEVVWPDASLGCPQPGMRYKQVPYDGALILLSAGGQLYSYHSGGNRGVFLCEKSPQITKSAPKIDLIPSPGSVDD
jgi:hypothetical protein